jgi:hypothetical protein
MQAAVVLLPLLRNNVFYAVLLGIGIVLLCLALSEPGSTTTTMGLAAGRVGQPTGAHTSMMMIAAYYQMGPNNRVAAYAALRLFRSVYPDAPLHIHYDAINTTTATANSELANVFHATSVSYAEGMEEKSTTTSGGMYFTVQGAEKYLERLRAAALLRPRGWLLLLEDDVWVWSQVNTSSDLAYDISGHCWLSLGPTHSRFIRAHSASPVFQNATCYGGSGGSFVRSERLIGLNRSTTTSAALRSFIKDLIMGGELASDLLLSAVILWDGGDIGWYSGYYDFVVVGFGYPRTFHHMKWLYFLRYVFG